VKTSLEAPQIGSLIENLHEAVNGLERRKKKRKRIRSLGENLPWRHPGQAIKVKTSLKRPSCFQKKKRKGERKMIFQLYCKCRRSTRKERMEEDLLQRQK